MSKEKSDAKAFWMTPDEFKGYVFAWLTVKELQEQAKHYTCKAARKYIREMYQRIKPLMRE